MVLFSRVKNTSFNGNIFKLIVLERMLIMKKFVKVLVNDHNSDTFYIINTDMITHIGEDAGRGCITVWVVDNSTGFDIYDKNSINKLL